jgi:hypothetical protein
LHRQCCAESLTLQGIAFQSQGSGGALLHVAEAAEVSEEALAGLGAGAGDRQQLGIAVAHGAALAMVADGQAMAVGSLARRMARRSVAAKCDDPSES